MSQQALELQGNCSCGDLDCAELKVIGQRILDGLAANGLPGGNSVAYWTAIDDLEALLGRVGQA